MASRWVGSKRATEERARSFLNTLLEKDQVVRARAFCKRDEIHESLREELLATIQEHEDAKKRAREEEARAEEAIVEAQRERDAEDKARYGEIRSLTTRREWRAARALAATLARGELKLSANQLIDQQERAHQDALAERFAGQKFVAIDGGGALLLDDAGEAVQHALIASRDWGGSPRRRRYNASVLRAIDGAGSKLLDSPQLIGDVVEAFGWEGRYPYSWWKPDRNKNSADETRAAIAESATTLTREQLDGVEEDFFLGEEAIEFVGEGDFVARDPDEVARWLRVGGDRPELTDEWEWDEGERRGWNALLDRMKLYAGALRALDELILDFFGAHDADPPTIMKLSLVPEENENDAWVYEALVGEAGVIMLGSFYEL